jgi:hypothetical protein
MRALLLLASFTCVFLTIVAVFELWPRGHFTCPSGFEKQEIPLHANLIYVCVKDDK